MAKLFDLLQPGSQAPIHDPRRDNVRWFVQREEDRGRGRHARAKQQRLVTALQSRDQVLSVLDRNVIGASVDVSRSITIVGITDEG